MKFSREQILKRLTELGVKSQASRESAVERLLDLSPELVPHFERWFETGELPDIEIEGFTPQKLREGRILLDPGVFIALDALIKDPEAAKRMLAEGYDHVFFE